MKTAAGAFLAHAGSRLLPASIPFRFFGAAVVFHLLGWLALLASAADFPGFAGGLGRPLAALHLITLGVLVMVALGASLQLLPVATRQPVRHVAWPVWIWWLYTPGVALLTLGMASAAPALLGAGAVAVIAALGLYAVLLAANLRGARGMPGVVAHGWTALAALAVLTATALALVGNYLGLALIERTTALALHVAFAAYGFMGMLALGLAYILVPMFTLSPNPSVRSQLVSCGLAVAALAAAGAAAFGIAPMALRAAAVGAGAVAVALHLMLMRTSLRDGMRQRLGRSFVLVRLGWASLAASLAAALGIALEWPVPRLHAAFGLLLVGGWLLSFALGMLQRILPFLASMHGARTGRRAPTPASFTAERPLAIHFACHVAALAGLALAIGTDSSPLAALAAAVGSVGALAFAGFYMGLVRRMALPASAPAPAVRAAPH